VPRVFGAAKITVGFGPVVDGHLMQLVRQLAVVDQGAEPLHGAVAVLVLSTGEGVEQLSQSVSSRVG
jgi:hypothetical protein